jgi:type IV fimbrial biogenesis protein FimT
MHAATPKLQGFTLIELLMTLVIAGILATLAAPSFVDVIKNNRMTTQYNDLLATLSLARSEAIKQGTNVIALSNNGTSWEDGWIIFIDADSDGTVDAGEELRVNPKLSGNNTLNFARDRITYASTGLGSGLITGTFTLCDDRGNSDRKGLVVSTTGRTRHSIAADVLAACP